MINIIELTFIYQPITSGSCLLVIIGPYKILYVRNVVFYWLKVQNLHYFKDNLFWVYGFYRIEVGYYIYILTRDFKVTLWKCIQRDPEAEVSAVLFVQSVLRSMSTYVCLCVCERQETCRWVYLYKDLKTQCCTVLSLAMHSLWKVWVNIADVISLSLETTNQKELHYKEHKLWRARGFTMQYVWWQSAFGCMMENMDSTILKDWLIKGLIVRTSFTLLHDFDHSFSNLCVRSAPTSSMCKNRSLRGFIDVIKIIAPATWLGSLNTSQQPKRKQYSCILKWKWDRFSWSIVICCIVYTVYSRNK